MSMSIEDAAVPRAAKSAPNIPNEVFQQLSMKGKCVAITGGADGIGLAVAEAVAEAGGSVALWYNANAAAIERSRELENKYGVKSKAYQVEVADYDAVEQAMHAVVADFGKLDVFVANAGMAITKSIIDQTIPEYRKQMGVNLDGVYFCAKYAGTIFKKQGFGNLIITSSISAHIVNVPIDQPVYNTTKAAVTHLGKSLAREWRDFARVNIVSPGFFDTKMGATADDINEVHRMTVLGRVGHTKEIKALYLYLASDASTYMTGSDIVIDGGYILP